MHYEKRYYCTQVNPKFIAYKRDTWKYLRVSTR